MNHYTQYPTAGLDHPESAAAQNKTELPEAQADPIEAGVEDIEEEQPTDDVEEDTE